MDLLSGIALGLDVAITGEALLFCLIGVSVGMFIGVLPGIGPLASVHSVPGSARRKDLPDEGTVGKRMVSMSTQEKHPGAKQEHAKQHH